VEEEYRQIVEVDGAPHTLTQAEYARVAASFVPPTLSCRAKKARSSAQRTS
jgi:sulfite reductase (NADPH) hemoprotein beta-component